MGMQFWIVLARDKKEPFEPFLRDGKLPDKLPVYSTRKAARSDLLLAQDLFGKRNAYLQKLGPIS